MGRYTLEGVRVPLHPEAYPPYEDSVLLLRQVPSDLSGRRVVETCCGHGVSGVRAALNGAEHVTLVDLYDAGLEAATAVARRNDVADRVGVVRGDALGPVGAASVDLVLANPPYLPTGPDDPPDVALDGGPDGLDITRAIFEDLPRVLRPGGEALVLMSSLQPLDEAAELLRDLGLVHEVVAEEGHGLERLEVWRILRAADGPGS